MPALCKKHKYRCHKINVFISIVLYRVIIEAIIILKKRGSIYITSNGCVPNRLEAKKIAKLFLDNGWKIVADAERSDLIIFNTCGYNGDKIDEYSDIINELNIKRKKNSQIYVMGCLPKIIKVKENNNNIKFLEFSEINSLLGSEEPIDKLYVSNVLIDNLETASKEFFHIITSIGCMGSCSYCAIRKARGYIKSKPIDSIINEFKEAIDNNKKKIILWGDDLGAYGYDIGKNLINLLSSILQSSKTDFRIFLNRLNAQWLINYFQEFKPIFNSGKVMQIYTPIQSGSDKILKLMNRKYKINEIIYCLEKIHKNYPNIIIKTDIMIGFPFENNSDFELTLNLLESGIFADVSIFKFKGVPGTKAYYMTNQVSEKIKNSRMKKAWKSFIEAKYNLFEMNGIILTSKKNGYIIGPLCKQCFSTAHIRPYILISGLKYKYYYCRFCDKKEEVTCERPVIITKDLENRLTDLNIFIKAFRELNSLESVEVV